MESKGMIIRAVIENKQVWHIERMPVNESITTYLVNNSFLKKVNDINWGSYGYWKNTGAAPLIQVVVYFEANTFMEAAEIAESMCGETFE